MDTTHLKLISIILVLVITQVIGLVHTHPMHAHIPTQPLVLSFMLPYSLKFAAQRLSQTWT